MSYSVRRLAGVGVLAAACLALPAVASAAVPLRGAQLRTERAAKPFFDVRSAARARAARPGAAALRPTSAASRDARSSLRRSLGRQALVDVDDVTGTVRMLGRLDGTLTGPAPGAALDRASGYVRANLDALGLTADDLGTLGTAQRLPGPGTSTIVRWRQEVAGIPAFDNELRVTVTRDGRIVNVFGSPRRALAGVSTTPTLSASDALGRAMADVGVQRAVRVTSGPTGARRTTGFSGGHRARLVLFGGAGATRLAWRVTYAAGASAVYDILVDASSGSILHRANLVKFIDGLVFDQYPGAPQGGVQRRQALDAWLPAGSTTLSGPNAHTFADLNDNDEADAGEEIPPRNAAGDFDYPFHDFTAANTVGACDPQHQCSWIHTDPASWPQNMEQNAVQSFYYVNHFHDHLAAAPIGFDAASGNFEGDDPVAVNSDDGAETGTGPLAGLPDCNHRDNANMLTPPDGQSPRMQMFLFYFDPVGDVCGTLPDAPLLSPFRDVNGGDDGAVVYHEYTHGLTNRLVTDADGEGALNSPHAGAMGEAWSDWYAKDLLAREGFEVDSPSVAGEVDMGDYVDAVSHSIRFEALDCPVGGAIDVCSGGVDTGPGGFTLGDFAKVFTGAEVHSDGEIWAQTLWDLRTRLVVARGQAAGSDAAEALVTGGLRLSPPEPSFLDMRNAILQADVVLNGGDNQDLIWDVFRLRGMGFFAGAVDGSDVTPVEDFQPPPAAGSPTGVATGQVTDSITGLPLTGVKVGFAGHTTDPTFAPFLADTTDADGRYVLDAVPTGTYPKLAFIASAGYDQLVTPNVQINPGETTTRDAAVRRDWSASSGGAKIPDGPAGSNDRTGDPFGCGPDAAIDQSTGAGWSAFNPKSPNKPPDRGTDPPFVVITLPATVDVTQFGIDPSNTCGDGPSASTKDILVETAGADGVFQPALQTTFTADNRNKLNLVTPTANATGVKSVRVTLLSPLQEGPGFSGTDFIDLSEFEVFGAPPNTLPSGTLAGDPATVAVGQPVTFQASFTDPDSAITGYDWDFEGDGTFDAHTAGPSTQHAFGAAGSFTTTVRANDFRGGGGNATTTVTVTGTGAGAVGGARETPRRGARPTLSIQSSALPGRATFMVGCSSACTATARMTITRATSRRLGAGRTVLARATRRLARAGRRPFALTVSRALQSRLRRRGARSLRVTVSVSIRDAAGQIRTTRRAVRVLI